MNQTDIILELTNILVGIVLFFALKYFLPGYAQEKGKNLATKQDIEEITRKVESVKIDFSKDLEYIKSDLQFQNQSLFSIKSAEREALIDTNLKYAEWLNYLMNLSFSNITMYNYERLNDYFSEIKNKKLQFDTAEARLHLFLHDDDLLKVKLESVLATIKLEYIIVQCIGNLTNEFALMNAYFVGLDKLGKSVDLEWYKRQKSEASKGVDKIFYNMTTEKEKQFVEVYEKRVIFVKTLRKRLYDITN